MRTRLAVLTGLALAAACSQADRPTGTLPTDPSSDTPRLSGSLSPVYGPPSDAGIAPLLVAGNLSGNGTAVCNDPRINTSGQTWSGIKVDPPVGGTFAGISVTLSGSENQYLAWDASSATNLLVKAVVVKGGPDAYVYYYNPPTGAPNGTYTDASGNYVKDAQLRSPLNEGGNIPGISHYTLCYDDDFTPDNTPKGTLTVKKFYDANANGSRDAGEPLIAESATTPGWAVAVSGPNGFSATGFTTLTLANLVPGSYTATEGTPVETNWFHTTPTSVTAAVTAGATTYISFGNVCVGAGGGRTLGFWSNRNGQALWQAAWLAGYTLRRADGSVFVPAQHAYGDFRTWILGANATNMAYMLSAQTAAMALNVGAGFVSANALIYAPGTSSANALGFATVGAVLAEAQAILAGNGTILAGDPLRARAEAVKNALDRANNNQNFVQAQPCPFTFAAS